LCFPISKCNNLINKRNGIEQIINHQIPRVGEFHCEPVYGVIRTFSPTIFYGRFDGLFFLWDCRLFYHPNLFNIPKKIALRLCHITTKRRRVISFIDAECLEPLPDCAYMTNNSIETTSSREKINFHYFPFLQENTFISLSHKKLRLMFKKVETFRRWKFFIYRQARDVFPLQHY
jgi:hypothetical protein